MIAAADGSLETSAGGMTGVEIPRQSLPQRGHSDLWPVWMLLHDKHAEEDF
jgi:hypothetical protein